MMDKKKAAALVFAAVGLIFLILWFYNLMAHKSMLITWVWLALAAVCAYLSKRMNK